MANPVGSNITPLKAWNGDIHSLDFENRDPKNIHTDLKLNFDDAIAEPDSSLFSPECIWKYSHRIFNGSKFCWYKFLAVVCALPNSCCWGLCYACYAYFSIWCMQPCFRLKGLKTCLEYCFDICFCCFCGTVMKAMISRMGISRPP